MTAAANYALRAKALQGNRFVRLLLKGRAGPTLGKVQQTFNELRLRQVVVFIHIQDVEEVKHVILNMSSYNCAPSKTATANTSAANATTTAAATLPQPS